MRCFYHDEAAAASCNRCGKGLCKKCVITMDNGEIICPDCFRSVVASQKHLAAKVDKRFVIGKILGALAFGYCLIQFGIGGIVGALVIGLWIAACPIAIFWSNKTDDPYVPTSWEGAGNLVLGKLAIAIIGAPFFAISSIKGQRTRKTIIANNEALLAQISGC